MKLSSLLKIYVCYLFNIFSISSSQRNEATDFPLPHFRYNFRHNTHLSKIIFLIMFFIQFSCCLITSDNIDNSLSTWIGFAICPFIPAAIASRLSSSNAFAVMAIIGIFAFFISCKCLIHLS